MLLGRWADRYAEEVRGKMLRGAVERNGERRKTSRRMTMRRLTALQWRCTEQLSTTTALCEKLSELLRTRHASELDSSPSRHNARTTLSP